ncbi:MAG TPA: hypothetical protein VGA99_00625 [bacterium]
MSNSLITTIEIMLIINAPLLVLYLRGNWPKRVIIPCLIILPLLWYLTYALLHELSHVAGTYLVCGRVVEHQLIPRFWAGEFGRAWIKTEGFTQSWQLLVSTCFPYLLDVAGIVIGMLVLGRRFSTNAFVIGLVFMLLCLRSAFDFASELTGFLSGDKGDFAAIVEIAGSATAGLF